MATIESILRKAGWSEEHKIRYCRNAVSSKPDRFGDVLNAVVHPDPYVRIAAAKAADAASEDKPSVVEPFKNLIIYKAAKVEQIEVRRYLIRVIPRMRVTEREYVDTANLIREYVHCYDAAITESCIEAIDILIDREYPETPLRKRFFELLTAIRRRAVGDDDDIGNDDDDDSAAKAGDLKRTTLFKDNAEDSAEDMSPASGDDKKIKAPNAGGDKTKKPEEKKQFVTLKGGAEKKEGKAESSGASNGANETAEPLTPPKSDKIDDPVKQEKSRSGVMITIVDKNS